jgi:hypothetical protein
MGSILELGAEHLPAVLGGRSESLSPLLEARFGGWGLPYAHEGFITVGLFSDLEQQIKPEVAFALVGPALNLALSEKSPTKLTCALSLLSSLVEATKTTEVPTALKQSFPDLAGKAEQVGGEASRYVTELRRYYRNSL